MKWSNVVANIATIYIISFAAGMHLKHHSNSSRVRKGVDEYPLQHSSSSPHKKYHKRDPLRNDDKHLELDNALGNDIDVNREEDDPDSLFGALNSKNETHQGTKHQRDSHVDQPNMGGDSSAVQEKEKCDVIDGTHPHESVKGLEYLGCGYDVTKSKPFGDGETFLDTGYTQPVIQFEWPCENNDKSPIIPLGVWVRREPACHRGHEKREIQSEESLASMLSEDVNSFIGVGELGVNSVKQSRDIKALSNIAKKHTFALKSNCAVFTTGMLLSSEWNVTRAFNNATKLLLEFPNMDKCNAVENYRLDTSCKEYYKIWEGFFNSYGTHVISRLTMGGKILQIFDSLEAMENSAKSHQRNARVDFNFSLITGNLTKEQEKESEIAERAKHQNSKIFIMGGDDFISADTPYGFRSWVESIEHNAMPINIQLTPISQFIPQEIRKHFWRALKIYSGT
ncbi:uncharacterized protein BXIN_0686 [Babesia sp. Xinjiang]|uniref:uncharacterized protein n=1 Tax=Babesia sp. Xinjiang TaxID=462227 RepID=UPI000A251E32|nr:uncharacterized protein BXIN_0713 [Babesia sp. Xinjiang]XP_028872601.1 uncharacterized protein BXIN_0686 [Babesia sp. Xinjiang]ORM42106.1 hypothetical protein BXIN_0713 [Babesia sp. Xinjiang]ORM42145.1 hypothetical protein BXIN_0686 [Babesia sp. Xinjiang]